LQKGVSRSTPPPNEAAAPVGTGNGGGKEVWNKDTDTPDRGAPQVYTVDRWLVVEHKSGLIER
jgi:hypothetical protein